MTIEIIKKDKPKKTKRNSYNLDGDILYGGEYLTLIEGDSTEKLKRNVDKFVGDKKWIVPYMPIGDPWTNLYNAGVVNARQIRDSMIYECPFNEGDRYYWAIPVVLCASNPDDYHQIPNENSLFGREFPYTRIKCAHDNSHYLGHGYTDGTLPMDGHGETRLAKTNLSNGDFLLMVTWEWYNK